MQPACLVTVVGVHLISRNTQRAGRLARKTQGGCAKMTISHSERLACVTATPCQQQDNLCLCWGIWLACGLIDVSF